VTHLQASKHTSNIAGSHFHRQEQQICINTFTFSSSADFCITRWTSLAHCRRGTHRFFDLRPNNSQTNWQLNDMCQKGVGLDWYQYRPTLTSIGGYRYRPILIWVSAPIPVVLHSFTCLNSQHCCKACL